MNPFLGTSASSTETSTTSSLSLSPQMQPRWITSISVPPPLSGLLLPPPAFTRGPPTLSYPHDRPPLPPLLFAPHQTTARTHLTHESLMATAAAHLYSHAHRHSDHFDHQSPPRPQLPFATLTACPQPQPPTNSPTAGAAPPPPRPQEASTPQHKVMLQIGVQPQNRTVYQRLLKPYPSVYLIVPPLPSGQEAAAFSGGESGEALRQLHWALRDGEGVFVEASVVRNDNGDTLDRSIDGVTSVRLEKSDWHSGVYTATFKKLKLLTTSQQRSGTKFSLCFRLTCSELALGSLADLSVTSSPIEVFSHSLYLSQAEEDGGAKREQSSPKNAIARKYGNNCAGLQLKIMEMIHGFRELGGSEQAMHESVSAMFSPHGDSVLTLFNSIAAPTSPSAQAAAAPPVASEPTPTPPVSSSSLQHLLNPTPTHPHPHSHQQHHDQLVNAWMVHTALATASGRSPPSSGELRHQSIDEGHRSKRARRRSHAAGSPEATASDSAASCPPPASRLPSIASLLDDTRPITNLPGGAGKTHFNRVQDHQGRSLEEEGEEEEGEEEQKDRTAHHRRRRRRHNNNAGHAKRNCDRS